MLPQDFELGRYVAGFALLVVPAHSEERYEVGRKVIVAVDDAAAVNPCKIRLRHDDNGVRFPTRYDAFQRDIGSTGDHNLHLAIAQGQ